MDSVVYNAFWMQIHGVAMLDREIYELKFHIRRVFVMTSLTSDF